MGIVVRHLCIQPGSVDLLRQNDKLMLHIDDLIQVGPEKIIVIGLPPLFWSHQNPRTSMHSGNYKWAKM